MGNPTCQQWNYFHSIQGLQKFPSIFKEVSGYWAAENAEIRVWHNPESWEIQDLRFLSNSSRGGGGKASLPRQRGAGHKERSLGVSITKPVPYSTSWLSRAEPQMVSPPLGIERGSRFLQEEKADQVLFLLLYWSTQCPGISSHQKYGQVATQFFPGTPGNKEELVKLLGQRV